MGLQPLQRLFLKRVKLIDRQAESNQGQAGIGGEDVGERVACKMMLGCRLPKRIESLKISIIHTALDGKEGLVSAIKLFRERGVEAIRADHDPSPGFTPTLPLVPADACHASILPDQLFDVRTQPNVDV